MSERQPLLLTEEATPEPYLIQPPPEEEERHEQDEYVTETGPRESTRRHKVVLALVFMVIFFERIGYHSVDYGLDLDMFLVRFTFHTPDDYVIYQQLVKLGIQAGGQFLFPLIGAWLGECLLGVHTTAVFGTVIEFISGLLLLISTEMTNVITLNDSHTGPGAPQTTPWTPIVPAEPSSLVVGLTFSGLILITFGLSLTRSNYIMLAAAQIPERELIEKGFFHWYVFTTNFAAVIAIGVLSWLPRKARAMCWPVSFFISLMLLLAVRCVSTDQLNQTNRKGFRKLLECFSCCRSRSELDENVSRLRAHMIRIFLFICMLLPYILAYGPLQTPLFPYGIWSFRIFLLGNPSFQTVLIQLYEPVSIVVIIVTTSILIGLSRYSTSPKNSLKCVAIGMAFVTISCIMAALRDWFGRFFANFARYDYIGSQFPQVFVLGLSAVLCQVKAMEFIYTETPKQLKNQMLGLYLTAWGLGYGVSLMPILIMQDSSDELSAPSRIMVWGIIAGINVVLGLLPFMLFASKYQYRDEQEHSVSPAIDGRRERVFGGSEYLDDSDSEEEADWCCS